MALSEPTTLMLDKVKLPATHWSKASSGVSLSSISMPSSTLARRPLLTNPPDPLRNKRPCFPPTPTMVQPLTVGVENGISSADTFPSSESSPSSSPPRSPMPLGWSWMASQLALLAPRYPWSQSKLSSPAKATTALVMDAVPPKNSMPSSRLETTSMWSRVVPLPTPPRVKPLISLAAASCVPP